MLVGNSSLLDSVDNQAIVHLPESGSINALDSNSDLVVDGFRPFVTEVYSDTSFGVFNEGDTIMIAVKFRSQYM